MVVAALVGVVCFSAPAEASSDDRFNNVGVYLLYAGEGLSLAGSLVTSIGCGVSLGVRDEPSMGWMVSSYIFGGLNVAFGIASFAISDGHTFNLAAGGIHLGMAAINITLSSLALVKRRRYIPPPPGAPTVQVSIAPLVAPTPDGGSMLGVGVQVFGW